MLRKILNFFRKQKTPRELNRELARTITRTTNLSNKLTLQINSSLRQLQKLLLLNNANEIKRISRQIVKLQLRRDKNDKRVDRLEGIRDTLLDAISCCDVKIDEIVDILEKQLNQMETTKGGIKDYEQCRARIEVIGEEVCEDDVNDEIIDELAEQLVHKTINENL